MYTAYVVVEVVKLSISTMEVFESPEDAKSHYEACIEENTVDFPPIEQDHDDPDFKWTSFGDDYSVILTKHRIIRAI